MSLGKGQRGRGSSVTSIDQNLKVINEKILTENIILREENGALQKQVCCIFFFIIHQLEQQQLFFLNNNPEHL